MVVTAHRRRHESPGRAGLSRLCEQAELAGAAGGVYAGAGVELAQQVPYVHVDRARAEEQLGRDLAVGAARTDEPDDLQLAAGEAGAVDLGGGAAPEAADDRLAERRHLARRLGRERPGSELARRA